MPCESGVARSACSWFREFHGIFIARTWRTIRQTCRQSETRARTRKPFMMQRWQEYSHDSNASELIIRARTAPEPPVAPIYGVRHRPRKKMRAKLVLLLHPSTDCDRAKLSTICQFNHFEFVRP